MLISSKPNLCKPPPSKSALPASPASPIEATISLNHHRKNLSVLEPSKLYEYARKQTPYFPKDETPKSPPGSQTRTVLPQCSSSLKLPCTTTFSKMDPGGTSIVLPSVATMMTVPFITTPLPKFTAPVMVK